MEFFIQILVHGILAGAIYALTSLAFVVVYKASRTINFALAEFVMVATKLVTLGLHVLGLGVAGGIGFACAGMVAFAVGFNRFILRHLVGRPLIALIMVTIGLGVVLRASAMLLFAGIPGSIPLPIPQEPIVIRGVRLFPGDIVVAVIAIVCITGVSWFFHRSRAGVALRAMAEDQQAAMLVGINLNRYIALTWALAGIICVVAGTLWTAVAGGGFSVVLLGFKMFPIVMIGGLDSISGLILGAVFIGLLESLASAYINPLVPGFSTIAAYLVLIAVLFVRPYGVFGTPGIERV